MAEFSLERLNRLVNKNNVYNVDGYSFGTVETGFDISPDEFLDFAKYDLAAKYDHHLVNSLSNTKRAIDSQLDSLLIGFGLSKRAKNWHFPAKINFLHGIGIISPRILNKINKKRNLLEHEYKNPTEEEVEDALDVAELFISYTNKYLIRAIRDFYLIGEDLNCDLILDWDNCKIVFEHRVYIDDTYSGKKVSEELTADQKDYDECLKLYLKLYEFM